MDFRNQPLQDKRHQHAREVQERLAAALGLGIDELPLSSRDGSGSEEWFTIQVPFHFWLAQFDWIPGSDWSASPRMYETDMQFVDRSDQDGSFGEAMPNVDEPVRHMVDLIDERTA